jgi:hypothetical protein
MGADGASVFPGVRHYNPFAISTTSTKPLLMALALHSLREVRAPDAEPLQGKE